MRCFHVPDFHWPHECNQLSGVVPTVQVKAKEDQGRGRTELKVTLEVESKPKCSLSCVWINGRAQHAGSMPSPSRALGGLWSLPVQGFTHACGHWQTLLLMVAPQQAAREAEGSGQLGDLCQELGIEPGPFFAREALLAEGKRMQG